MISKYSTTGRRRTKREIEDSYLQKHIVKCKCGHSILMKKAKTICSHCGHWVYRNEKEEFKDKMKRLLV